MIFTEQNFHPTVLDAEFKRLLKLPLNYVFEDRLAESEAWVRAWFAEHGRPWLCAARVEGCAVEGQVVRLGDGRFESRELARRFRHAHAAYVVAASAGPEAETEAARQWETDEPDRYYFMENYASAVVEALIAEARGRLCLAASARGEAILPHYSPGYREWSVGDQAAVRALLGPGALPGPLEIMDSGMPRPKKTQLAVFAVAPAGTPGADAADLVPCRRCALARCEFRREAYALAP